ncbi:MAG: hypothetical protein ACR2J5_12275, partial [Geodermatophilaceae bacterium]
MQQIRSTSAILFIAVLLLGACGDSGSDSAPQATDPASNAAREAALEAAGGEELGGTVSMLGLLGGE